MNMFANIEDQDEIPHGVALHPGLLCLRRQNLLFREKEV